MEKVWKAEQRHDEEDRKTHELKRELASERRIMELQQIQQEATGQKRTDKLDWMYSLKKGPSAEEYLTGTACREQQEDKELEQLANKPGALWLAGPVNATVDVANKVRDDPLLMMKQAQHGALKEILNNPVKMKKIKESKEMKKLLKKQKKEKKEKKIKKEQESNNDHNGNSSTIRSRSRSHSPDRHNSHSHSRKASNSPPRNTRKEEPTHRYDDRKRKQSMTAEEKEQRLKAMMQDGEAQQDMRWKRIKHEQEKEAKECESQNKHKSFLNDMNKAVYTEHDEQLVDRVRRNIHYIQKDSGSLL